MLTSIVSNNGRRSIASRDTGNASSREHEPKNHVYKNTREGQMAYSRYRRAKTSQFNQLFTVGRGCRSLKRKSRELCSSTANVCNSAYGKDGRTGTEWST